VLFFGYDFDASTRFVSELEVEHVIVSNGERGAVELEQAYLEFDLDHDATLRTGLILMPIGIINETHEPVFFYGVERPVIETTIIPTTWWSGGVQYSQRFASGISYDLMLSEGLKTPDPAATVNADPFDPRLGKQKTSFAAAHDLALTARLRYTGIAGVELATYTQYQPDLDQSAVVSYADAATLLGGHGIFRFDAVTFTALYARWDLDGVAAATAGKDVQDGVYAELSYRYSTTLGVFTRASDWSQQSAESKQQLNVGFNYWPRENIVYKFDLQSQNIDAGNQDGFFLGMGYDF
jgi:hypothetical protein